MSPYFAHDPASATLFGVTIGIWVVLECRQRLRRRSGSTGRDRGSYQVLVVCIAAGWLVTGLTATRVAAGVIGGQPVPLVLGFVLAWAGIGLRWWSFHTLGAYFTFTVQTSADQPVITDGPYRVLRHPSYAAIELTLVGMGLLYGNWIGVAAMVIVPMVGLANRIRVEERALRSDLGDSYARFAATRKRLIPFVW